MFLNFVFFSLLTLGHLCSLGGSASILSFWRDRDIRKAPHLCLQRWELLGAVRAGGPLRILVQPNQTVVLQCRFCEDPDESEDDDDIGMWTYVDIVRGSAPVRVPRPIEGDNRDHRKSFFGSFRKPRLVVTEGQNLALRKPHTTDLGLYQCRRYSDKSSLGSTIRFLVDMDIALFEEQLKQEKENNWSDQNEDEDEDTEEDENSTTEGTDTVKDAETNYTLNTPYINGTSYDWPTYRKDHLDTLERVIAHSNLHLEAMSEWSSWTDCSQCWTTKYGVRVRRGVCVLRLPLHESADDDVIVTELAGLPALACRSAILNRLHPQIAYEARKVPDFIEYDYKGCDGVCLKNTSKSHGSLLHRLVYLFRHRRDTPLTTHRRLILTAGDALVIVCPGTTGETPVSWQKDGETIGGGSSKAPVHGRNPVQRMITELRKMEHWVSGRIVGIKDQPENTPYVDATGVLKVTSAAPRNSGNYECSVNGIPRGSFQVEVIVKSALSFDDLIRHFAYVSLVLLSGIMIWCGVVLCVTLRRRLKNNKYSQLRQTDGHRRDGSHSPTGYDNESSGSHPDTLKDPVIDEYALNPTGSANKRKQKLKSAVHVPSRRLSKAVRADSTGPLTASYHKVWSRLRIRPVSRRSSANDDVELVHLMVPQSNGNYQQRATAGRRCRQRSLSSSSADCDTPAGKGPVTIVSQQLFTPSQNVFRPAALMSVKSGSPTRANQNSPAQQPQDQAPSAAGLSPSWTPSAISVSVLRARNSLRQANIHSSSSNTSKLTKGVQIGQHPSKSQRYSTGGKSTDLKARKGPKKPGKCSKRHPRSKMSVKPRKSSASPSESPRRKFSSKLKKHPLNSPSHSSSSIKSPVGKKSAASTRTEVKVMRLGSRKSRSSKRADTSVKVIKKNSPVCPKLIPSSVQTSPRLSLLYRAPPSPKAAPSFSDSRDQFSCISFLSISANNSAMDPVADTLEREQSLDLPGVPADSVVPTNASVEKDAAPRPQIETKPYGKTCPKILTKQPQESDHATTGQSQRTSNIFQVSSAHHHSVPPSDSQQSMFRIPAIVDTQPQPKIPNLPLTNRKSSTLHRVEKLTQTQSAEQSESSENLNLVAAFLETSAQKKARPPNKPLLQPVSAPPVRSQTPSSHHGSFLMPQSVILASSGQSGTTFSTQPPPIRSSNSERCNVAGSLSMLNSASHSTTITPPEHPEPTQHKPPKQEKIAPTQTKPSSNDKSLNPFPTTQQLIPALFFPCAIALSDISRFTTGTQVLHPSQKLINTLETVSPATRRKSSTSSMKSSTSTMQTNLHPISELQVFPPPDRNTVAPSNVGLAQRIEGKVEDERMSLRSSTLIRSTNFNKEIRLRPSRGRNTSPSKLQSRKLVAVQSLDPSEPDVRTILHETRSNDTRGSGTPGRFRAPRTEAENRTCAPSDWVPAHHKITSKPPFSGKSLSYSGKLTAVTNLRKIASTKYSKHKGFYIRQKPGPEKFEIVLIDTDPLRDENVTTGTEQRKSSAAASKEKNASGAKKKSSKSRGAVYESVTKLATRAGAIATPEIVSTNLLWSANSPLINNDIVSHLPKTETSATDQPIFGKPQPIPSKAQLIRSDSQPIRSDSQPIRSEFQSVRSEPQQTRSEPQRTRSKLKPIRGVPRPTLSEPSRIPTTTKHNEPETARSEDPYRNFRPRSHNAVSSFQAHYGVSKRNLMTKASKGIRIKQSIQSVINRSKKNGSVTDSLEKRVRHGSNYDASNRTEISLGSEPTRLSFNKTDIPDSANPQSIISGFNPRVEKNSISRCNYVRLTQSLQESSTSPSLVKLISPERPYKSVRGFRTRLPDVLHKSERPRSPSKPVIRPPIHDSQFAAQLLFRETHSSSSHMTQVENDDIAVAGRAGKPVDPAPSSHVDLHGSAHGLHKPGSLRPHRSFRDEATSYGSLGDLRVKSRSIRIPTTEIALQVSNLDIHLEGGLKRSNSFPRRRHFTSTRRRSVHKSQANTPQGNPNKNDSERPNLRGRTAKTTYDHRTIPICNPPFETRTLNYPQDNPEVQPRLSISERKKSPQRVNPSESHPKSTFYPAGKANRARPIRKQPEPSTPRPNSQRSTLTSAAGSLSKSPRVKSPLAQKSPRFKQKSPTSQIRSPKTPPLSPSTKLRPLKSGTHCGEQACEDLTESTALSLQDYNSHSLISQSHVGNPQAEERTSISNVNVAESNPRTSQEKTPDDSSQTQPSSYLQQNLQQPQICNAHATDDIKYNFSGALANAARELIAISMTSGPTVSESEEQNTQVVEKSSAPMTTDNTGTSALPAVQSVQQRLSLRPKRSQSGPSSQRISRQRKTIKQLCRSLTFVSHTARDEAPLKRNLSVGARSKEQASGEVFVFSAQEMNHSRQNVSTRRSHDPLLLTSVSHSTCGESNVPVLDNSTSAPFLEDGFTSVRGLLPKELNTRRSNRKK